MAAGLGVVVVVLLPVTVLKDGDPFLLNVDGDVSGSGFVGEFHFLVLSAKAEQNKKTKGTETIGPRTCLRKNERTEVRVPIRHSPQLRRKGDMQYPCPAVHSGNRYWFL